MVEMSIQKGFLVMLEDDVDSTSTMTLHDMIIQLSGVVDVQEVTMDIKKFQTLDE